MFQNLEPLDKKKHADLKFRPVNKYAFTAKIPFAFLGGTEVAEAAKVFPVVFPEKDSKTMSLLPMALFSFKKNENPFVSENGDWRADYIPMHFRRYPFIFAAVPGQKNQFALMIDKDAPQLNTKEGTPLFDEKGEPGKIVTTARNVLGNFQQDIERTTRIVSLLEDKQVLVPKQFKMKKEGKETALRGFRVIDTAKLAALDDFVLAEWVRNGLMGMIFAHLHSLSNIKKISAMQDIEEPAGEA
jgi:hypothetical protein